MKKRYIVYINAGDDFKPIEYKRRHFKITTWLLVKKIKHTWSDVMSVIIYDRKKGDVIYEK